MLAHPVTSLRIDHAAEVLKRCDSSGFRAGLGLRNSERVSARTILLSVRLHAPVG
jgi:hypothetical protein